MVILKIRHLMTIIVQLPFIILIFQLHISHHQAVHNGSSIIHFIVSRLCLIYWPNHHLSLQKRWKSFPPRYAYQILKSLSFCDSSTTMFALLITSLGSLSFNIEMISWTFLYSINSDIFVSWFPCISSFLSLRRKCKHGSDSSSANKVYARSKQSISPCFFPELMFELNVLNT